MAITMTIRAPDGDLVFTELNLPADTVTQYPLIKPGGYSWTTGSTSEEGLALQPTATVLLTDTGNLLIRLVLLEQPYLRGRRVDIVSDGVAHRWELDTFVANGKTGVISLVSPLASALVQHIPSNPLRLTLDKKIEADDNANGAITISFAGRPRGEAYHGYPSSANYRYRIGDEVLTLPSQQGEALAERLEGSDNAPFDWPLNPSRDPGFSRARSGTEAGEHNRFELLTIVPVIEAPIGTAIEQLFIAVGKPGLVNPNVVTALNRYPTGTNPLILTISFYEDMQVAEVLADIAIVTGMLLYWNVDNQQMEVTVPGITNTPAKLVTDRTIIDSPLPMVSLDSRQYTRAQLRAQKPDLSEQEYTQVSTSVDISAEAPAQYDRELLYDDEIEIFNRPLDDDTNPAGAILVALNAATARIVRRYRDPRQLVSFSATDNIPMASLVRLSHPSVPSQDRLYQIISVDSKASQPWRTYKAASIGEPSGLGPQAFNNQSFSFDYSVNMMNLNLAAMLRTLDYLDPSRFTGTLTITLTGNGTSRFIGSTTTTTGALHIAGFTGVTNIVIRTDNLTLVGRGGAQEPANQELRHGGAVITVGDNGGALVTASTPTDLRPGGGAGGGIGTVAIPGLGYGWSDMGLQQRTNGTAQGITVGLGGASLTAGNGGLSGTAGTPATYTATGVAGTQTITSDRLVTTPIGTVSAQAPGNAGVRILQI